MPRSAGWAVRAALGAGLAAGTWLALRDTRVQRLDVRLGDAIRESSSPLTDRVVVSTTDLGSVYAVAGVACALAAARRPRAATDVLGVGLATWTVAQWAKTGVRRERPYEAEGVRRLIRPPTGSSFPSGHAAVGTAMFTLLADRSRGRRAAGFLRGVGTYVALSRVYVGVHYPTDVLGGIGMGLAIGSLWRGPVAAAGRALVSAVPRTLDALAGRAVARRWPSA